MNDALQMVQTDVRTQRKKNETKTELCRTTMYRKKNYYILFVNSEQASVIGSMSSIQI